MNDDATRPLIVGLPDVPWLDPEEGTRRGYPSRAGRGARVLVALTASALALAGTVLVAKAIDASPPGPLARTEASALSILDTSDARDIVARLNPPARS